MQVSDKRIILSEEAIALYVCWINGDRKYVIDHIALSDKKMIMISEICLKFLQNDDLDLRHFLTHVRTHA